MKHRAPVRYHRQWMSTSSLTFRTGEESAGVLIGWCILHQRRKVLLICVCVCVSVPPPSLVTMQCTTHNHRSRDAHRPPPPSPPMDTRTEAVDVTPMTPNTIEPTGASTHGIAVVGVLVEFIQCFHGATRSPAPHESMVMVPCLSVGFSEHRHRCVGHWLYLLDEMALARGASRRFRVWTIRSCLCCLRSPVHTADPISNTVWVGNVHRYTIEAELVRFFEQCGPVVSVTIHRRGWGVL